MLNQLYFRVNFGDLKTTKLTLDSLSISLETAGEFFLKEFPSWWFVSRGNLNSGDSCQEKKMQRRHCMETTVLRKDSLLVSPGPKV